MTSKTTQEKLTAVDNFLKSGNPEKAMQQIDKDTHEPVLLNARGVCLLRQNKIDLAMEIFKEIVFQNFIFILSFQAKIFIRHYYG